MNDTPPLWPSLAIIAAAILWGLYWIPMRELQALGIDKAWPSFVLNGSVVLVLLPGAIFYWRRFRAAWGSLALSGLLIGAGLSLYGISLNLTEVVRAVLLFYLTPAWSTVIGLIWLGERLTLRRVGALLFGFAGLLVVLKADVGVPLPQSLGDWLALAAGFAWSLGSARIFVGKDIGTFETAFSFALGTVIVTGVMILLFPPETLGAVPSMSAIADGWWILALGVLVLMLPIFFLTVWGTKHLTPATVGILLLGDIVVAILSAAILLTDEPFGTREIIGTILIAGAGLIEALPRRPSPAKMQM